MRTVNSSGQRPVKRLRLNLDASEGGEKRLLVSLKRSGLCAGVIENRKPQWILSVLFWNVERRVARCHWSCGSCRRSLRLAGFGRLLEDSGPAVFRSGLSVLRQPALFPAAERDDECKSSFREGAKFSGDGGPSDVLTARIERTVLIRIPEPRLMMANFDHKPGKRRDDSGLGSVVDFLLANARVVLGVSGAAVLAIATLVVKRLIDRATSPSEEDDLKAKQQSLEESWQELSLITAVPKPQLKMRREDLEEPLLSPALAVAVQDPESCDPTSPAPVVESRSLLCLSLQERLLSCYRDHISVSEAEKTRGKELAEDICAELQNFLKSKHSELPFGNMFLRGYLCDDLAGGHHLEVAFMLPLVLESNLWRLIPGEQTVVNNPSFAMIKRTDLEYFPRGNSPWDRFIVGGYLSSNAINRVLQKIFIASVNWPAIGSMLECVVWPAMTPGELKLEVRHERIHLDITLCPVMEAGDKIFLSVSFEEPVENLWQQSFYAAEVSKLKDLDAGDSGVRQCCLSILKFVFESHPFWRKLTGSHLSHVLLHLSESESDWSEATLADRLQQVLEELVLYLEKGSLPCYFDSRINLLSHLHMEEIDEIGYTLYEALLGPDLVTGLGL